MREIVLYPGESITIGDTVVKAETRPVLTPPPQIPGTEMRHQLRGLSSPEQWPQGPWTNPNNPPPAGTTWCGVAQGTG